MDIRAEKPGKTLRPGNFPVGVRRAYRLDEEIVTEKTVW